MIKKIRINESKKRVRQSTYLGSVEIQGLKNPEVALSAGLEFEGANRVVDVFQTDSDKQEK